MPKPALNQAIASGIGIALLGAMVTLAAYWVSSAANFATTALLGNLIAIPFAGAAWTGVLWKRGKATSYEPESWIEWVAMFFVGLAMSALFVFMDCGWHVPLFRQEFICDGHPGFSAIFTFAAISVTFIALPSAARAWALEVLSKRQKRSGE